MVVGQQTQMTQTSSTTLQLLTQNMWMTNTSFKAHPASVPRAQMVATLAQQFDLVCLQELFCMNLPFIDNSHKQVLISGAEQYKLHYAQAPTPNIMFQDSGLFITSKYKIVQQHHHMFENYSWAEFLNGKGILHARIEVTQGTILHLFTTHFDAHSESVKQAQVVECCAFIKACVLNEKDAIVLCGDFNLDSIASPNYIKAAKEFGKLGLQPALSSAPEQHPVTFPVTKQCLDHVFVKNVSCTQHIVENYKTKDNVAISDHYGVRATLHL